MPTIDASIYNALLQPRKSAMDYADEYAAADDRQMARQFNALKMQEAQQGLQDQAGYRNALKAASGTDEERINALIRSGNPLAIKHGQEMLKALLDAQKVQTDIGRTKAETGKLQGEAVDAALKRYRGALDFIDTPEGAKRWLQAQYSDPATAAYMQQLGPFEQAVTRIPTDPQGFQNWRGQAAMGMEKHMQQLRADAAQAETVRHNKTSEGIQVRGQNIVDARARETNDIQRQAGRTQVVETPDGVMLVDKGTGLARPAATFNGQPLPGKQSESMKKELVSIRQQRSIIDGALKAVEAAPTAFTFKRGLATMTGPLSESVAGRLDSDAERQARSYVFNNVSKVINERTGAAQSAQELARLRGFLPAETDSPDQIVSKLKAFQTYLDDLESGTTGKPSKPSAKPTGKPSTSNW